MDGITAVQTLDRAKVAEVTRNKYSLQSVGKLYDRIFTEVSDLGQKGWYTEHSHNLQGKICRELEAKGVQSVKLISYEPKVLSIPIVLESKPVKSKKSRVINLDEVKEIEGKSETE